MNSRTYDQVTDKFMDLSIEKTNSAYMLFYERIERGSRDLEMQPGPSAASDATVKNSPVTFHLSQALEEWIWKDNTSFIQDNNIFDHTYFK